MSQQSVFLAHRFLITPLWLKGKETNPIKHSHPMTKNIKACLFDMDGLLINTEDIYTETLSELLSHYGKGPLTWDVKVQLQGLPGPQAAAKVIEHYGLPITAEEYASKSVKIQDGKWGECSFLPGAKELICYLKHKNVPIALCTSSTKDKFHAKTSHLLNDFQLFDVIITGDDARIPKGRGKPFPDIYQLGLKELNKTLLETSTQPIKSSECLVFEDGVSGVLAGVGFGGYVIWCPHPDAEDHLPTAESIMQNNGEKIVSLEDLDKSKFNL